MSDDDGLADLKITTITHDDFRAKSEKEQRAPRAATPKKKPPLPPWREGVISEFVSKAYELSATMTEPYEPAIAGVLHSIAGPAGSAWENCARDSPALRRFFHALMTTSKFSELAMVHLPLFIILMHRFGPLRQATDEMADELRDAA